MEKFPKRLDRAPRGRTLNLLEQILSIFQARSSIGAFDLVVPRLLLSPIEPRLGGREIGLEQANQSLDRVQSPVGRFKGNGRPRCCGAVRRREKCSQLDEGTAQPVQLRVKIPQVIAAVGHYE